MAKKKTNLDFKSAGFWPESIKMVAYLFVFAAVVGISYVAWFNSKLSELKTLEAKEVELRDEYQKVQTKANSLPELKEELEQIEDLLATLVTRLPNQNEIPQLVVDVSQAALANGLNVDLFEPQDESKKEFYAEKRVNVNFKGGYHQLGAFFSEVAKQPRLIAVVVEDMKVEPVSTQTSNRPVRRTTRGPGGASTQLMDDNTATLAFSGTVRTYRYLSEEEEEEVAREKEEQEKQTSRRRR